MTDAIEYEPNENMRVLLEAVVNQVGHGRILDCGCGSGQISRWFSGKGCRVCAIDINLDDSLDGRVVRSGTGSVAWLKASAFTFSADPFQAVCLFGVLHYAGSEERAHEMIARVHELVADGGLLALNWITDEIPMPGVYLPAHAAVQTQLRLLGYQCLKTWTKPVEHDHGHGMHRHTIAYGAWIRGATSRGCHSG